MPDVLRDAGAYNLLDGELETLARGFQFTEGPLWLPDDSLLFQDIKAEKTYRYQADGGDPQTVREQTGAANGQTFAPDGRIVFCEQNGRRLSIMNPDGSGVTTLAETFEGKRLNSPNDVVARKADGLVYFTDPPYGAPPDRPLSFQGVYSIDPEHPEAGLKLLVADFEKPNGIAFSPDEQTLYICDTAKYHVRAFDLDASGGFKPGSDRIIAVLDPETSGGPDGLKVDQAGRLYVAVAQGVWVFGPGGLLLGIIAIPQRPSNLAWLGFDGKSLAITAVDTVYRLYLNTPGVLPPFLPRPN